MSLSNVLYRVQPKSLRRKAIRDTWVRKASGRVSKQKDELDSKSRSDWQRRIWWTGIDRRARDHLVALDNAFADLHENIGDEFVDSLVEIHQEKGYITPGDIERSLDAAMQWVVDEGQGTLRERYEDLSEHARSQAMERAGIDPVTAQTHRLLAFSHKRVTAQDEFGENIRRNFQDSLNRIQSLPASVVENIRERLMASPMTGADTRQVLRAVIGDLIDEIDPEGILDPEAVRQGIREIWEKTKTDLQRVIRTESVNAYAKAQLQEWYDQGIREVYRHSINDHKTCAKCRALSRPGHNVYSIGALLALEHPVTEDPESPGEFLTHPNCYLPGTSVRGEFIAGSRASYDGPAVEIRTAGGKCLRVTANHPVFTDKGWIPAKDVRPLHNLLGYAAHRRNTRPRWWSRKRSRGTRVEDVFRALRESAQSAHDRLDVGPDDFHGDSAGFVSKVEVVAAQGQLRGKTREKTLKRNLVSGAVSELVLEGQCPGHKRSLGVTPGHLPLTLECGHTGPLDSLRVGFPPDLDSCLHELGSNRPRADAVSSLTAERFGQALDGFPGTVTTDCVIQVREFHHSGHVYDLQSTTGLLVAEGIVATNCRCWFTPKTQDIFDEIEALERDLFSDLESDNVYVSDVPRDHQDAVENIMKDWDKHAGDTEAQFGFLADPTQDPDWQRWRLEELKRENPTDALRMLEEEIQQGAVVEWVDPETGIHYMAPEVAESNYVTLPFARRQGEIRWEQAGGDLRSWWEKWYKGKMAETEMTLDNNGVQIFGGLPFFTQAAGASPKDYFVEAYGHYIVDPVLIEALDAPAYNRLRDHVFGGLEYLERGGVK